MNGSAKRRARAKKLYDDRRKNGAFWNKRERANFLRRCRSLAKTVSVVSDDPDDIATVLYLDNISLREGVDFEFIGRIV